MEYYVYYRALDGLVVGDMSKTCKSETYKQLPLTEEQYNNLAGKINVRVVDGNLLCDDYIPKPTENQLIGQQVTDLEIASIVQCQQITDMEIKILTMEANAHV